MTFSEDIKRIFGGEEGLFPQEEVHLIGDASAVVTGHKGLLSLSSEAVLIRLKGKSLLVSGKDLRVVKASPSEIFIRGKIEGIGYPTEESR